MGSGRAGDGPGRAASLLAALPGIAVLQRIRLIGYRPRVISRATWIAHMMAIILPPTWVPSLLTWDDPQALIGRWGGGDCISFGLCPKNHGAASALLLFLWPNSLFCPTEQGSVWLHRGQVLPRDSLIHTPVGWCHSDPHGMQLPRKYSELGELTGDHTWEASYCTTLLGCVLVTK